MEEVWRDIPDFEGFYQANTEGRIKSLERNKKIAGYNVFYLGKVEEKILKPSQDVHGYLTVMFNKNGQKRCEGNHHKGIIKDRAGLSGGAFANKNSCVRVFHSVRF